MNDNNNPDLYVYALLTQMVTAHNGDISKAEEEIFARLCVDLGVVMKDGQVAITR